MRKLVFIFILFILIISGCQKYNGKESADTASINNYVTAAPQIEEKHDYIKEAHLPPQSWNPLTASDDELKYYKYPPKPLQSDKLIEWKKTVTGGWYDAKTDSIPIHSHANVPCKIVWNNQVYNLDTRCGPITGHKIGKIGNGIVYEIQDVDSSIGIVLGYGDYDGHRATRIDYDSNDALSMLFSDPNFIKEKLDNLNFPHSAKKIESYVNRGNKKIPVQLETKIEEPEKLNYIITFTEIWNTKDYSYDGCTQPVGNHYWRFKVDPNSYSDLGIGGDVPPQAEVDKEEAEKLIITVGPPGDKYSKAVKQGDTVEFIKRYQGEYAEIPIIIDTASEQGISMEQDSILIDCDAGWGIWEGIKPGGFVRSFHVQTNNTRNAKFIIKKILNNNNQNLLAEPLVFHVKIIDEPVHTKYIINSVLEHPDFQYLPMPSSQLKLYGFSTECFTLNNWVITGYFTDSPKEGLIINYNLHKNYNPPYIRKIPNIGKITLTGISEDKTKLFFKTDNGKIGEFDVTSENGCYRIVC